MSDTDKRREAVETLSKLISDMPVAMLTTCLPDRSLDSRPMVNVNSKFDGNLWFFTHDDDPKVREIQGNPQVSVSFSEPKQNRYVSVSGTAEVTHDAKHAELLWTSECDRWFGNGLQDPHLALLKIDVHRAEYWDEANNVMRAISGLFKHQKSVENEKIDWDKEKCS